MALIRCCFVCSLEIAVFPALDQLVNELAKFRYRSGNQWSAGGVTSKFFVPAELRNAPLLATRLTMLVFIGPPKTTTTTTIVRAPAGAVGHGGHYHSQSPEAYLAHTPGLTVVMPRSPYTAKGLLLASIRTPDPVIFLEPKALYRTAVEEVPVGDYELPLRQAEIVRGGTDVTVVGWGGQMRVLESACHLAEQQAGIHCELIDLQTIVPWDVEAVCASVQKTGKLVVSHEAPMTCGFGAEVVATVQRECFWSLQAPIQRVCGYDTPFPLVHEPYYVPNALKNLQAIVDCMEAAK